MRNFFKYKLIFLAVVPFLFGFNLLHSIGISAGGAGLSLALPFPAAVGLFAVGLGFYSHLTTDTPPSYNSVSVILVAYQEHVYLERTIRHILSTSPSNLLTEILVLDDASDPPLSEILESSFPGHPLIRYSRNPTREGLIRSKTTAARAATGDVIIYLDAHVKPEPGWMEPMIAPLRENYRRIVVPLIPVLDENMEQVSNFIGIKLLFDWKLDFIWYEDGTPEVPVMSGGLLAVHRRWFIESGEYDPGMLMWGGENVEQSVRNWLCGGDIIVSRQSRVGHVFREVAPYKPNVTQIHMNKARAVDGWFDDWSDYYYRANPFDRDRRPSEESIHPRIQLKEELGCKPFGTFVERFQKVFLDHGLLPQVTFSLRHRRTGQCLAAVGDGLGLADCDSTDHSQTLVPSSFGSIRIGSRPNDCLHAEGAVTLATCTAHDEGVKGWEVTEGDLRWKGDSVYIDDEGRAALTQEPVGLFETINEVEYNHELFK